MTDYLDSLNAVHERSRLQFGDGLTPPLSLISDQGPYGRLVMDAVVSDFIAGVVTRSLELPGNCFRFIRDASYVLFDLGIDHTVTIGNVSIDGNPHFTCTDRSVMAELREGFQPDIPANAHAWLTLDSGQVLDPTILPSHVYRSEKRELPLTEAIYLSGVSKSPELVYSPYLTGFAYHLFVVSHPLAMESYARYSEWLKHTHTYKHMLKKRANA